ncbi:hypothetical protein [Sphingomonas sp. R86521]|uniref:hypothetical protein n=1 Tax=Sphingomonas sp. R86521 TaxID=3093860 RepID=UPI0036D3F3EC
MNDSSDSARAAFATVPGTDYGNDYGMTFTDVPLPPVAPTTFVPGDDAFESGDGPDAHAHVSRRQDGWSAASQRAFLEAVAEGAGVDAAARRVGLSAASAYAFRRTAKGATFALGWRAACLVAREAITETLLVRALDGTVDTIVRGETVITRHKYDSRLALSLLARLDRQAETAADSDSKAARLVAQEFDAYLDLVGCDAGPARAGLFLACRGGGLEAGEGAHSGTGPDSADTRDLAPLYALAAADRMVRTGVATAAEVDIADLDAAHRADWTAGQWLRAEAAGMIAIAAPAPVEGDEPDDAAETAPAYQHPQCSRDPDMPLVWQTAEYDVWRTSFPPPEDFDGAEQGAFGDVRYERDLDAFELACMEDTEAVRVAAYRRTESVERDDFFAEILAATSDAEAAALLDEAAEQEQPEQGPPATVKDAQQPGCDDDESTPPVA